MNHMLWVPLLWLKNAFFYDQSLILFKHCYFCSLVNLFSRYTKELLILKESFWSFSFCLGCNGVTG